MDTQAICVVLLSTFFIALTLVLAYCWRWRRYFELGMKLPGPPALPIIGHCLYFTTRNLSKCFQEFSEVARSYGPVARLWFGPVLIVVLSDPDSNEKVVKHDAIGSRGWMVRKILDPAGKYGLLESEGDTWRKHRKIVSSALQLNILETFVDIFAKNSELLANKLKDLADGITVHDILPYFQICSLDVIFETCFGHHTNAQISDKMFLLDFIKTITDTATMKSMKPWFLIDWIFYASKHGKQYHNDLKYLREIMGNVVKRRKDLRKISENKSPKDDKPTILDLLVESGDLNEEEIFGEMNTIGGAGTDTVSHACCYVLSLLAENQHIQSRVMQEQEDIYGHEILRPVRSEDLPRMVYLEQVLKEAMRIFPPVPLLFREAVKNIDLRQGHIVPAGANIFISVYSIHRNPKIFPDPEMFDPDRFSPQNSAGRHPYAYTPFGFGRRMCVGHVFAIMEAKTILSTVLRRYCITEIEGGIKGLEKTLEFTFVLQPANGIRVKFLPRSYPAHVCVKGVCNGNQPNSVD